MKNAKPVSQVEPNDPTGTALANITSDADMAKKYATALVPMGDNVTARRIAAYTKLLETPFISGRFAAEAETIVTILQVADGEIADMADPTIMHPQHLFLVRLQTPLVYRDTTGKDHEHFEGDNVIVGLRKSKVRDKFVEIMREDLNNGAVLPNLLVTQVAASKPGWSPATTFRQLFPDGAL